MRGKNQSVSVFLMAIIIVLSLLPGVSFAESHMPNGFVDVKELSPSILLDIRYYGPYNFVGGRIDGYNAPKCILTKEAASALAKVQKELEKSSLSLKVYDCYRPQMAVDHFVQWARDMNDTRMREEFYPTLKKSDLLQRVYIDARSGHSRGSTVDLTLVPLPAPAQVAYRPGEKLHACYLLAEERFRDNSIDMGTGFDCFHTLSHTASKKVGAKQKKHRLVLKSIMEKYGFKHYHKEWWHFTLRKEPFPKKYFDFIIE
jgi:D-alanyl-D-alanine dipeptidase